MAGFSKFNVFVEEVCEKAHNLGTDTLKAMLSNTAPVATNTLTGDIVEITPVGVTYPAGGVTLTRTSSAQLSGTYRLKIADYVITPDVAETIGPFRYVVLVNSTADKLIGFWDRGSGVTLQTGDNHTLDFDGTNGVVVLT